MQVFRSDSEGSRKILSDITGHPDILLFLCLLHPELANQLSCVGIIDILQARCTACFMEFGWETGSKSFKQWERHALIGQSWGSSKSRACSCSRDSLLYSALSNLPVTPTLESQDSFILSELMTSQRQATGNRPKLILVQTNSFQPEYGKIELKKVTCPCPTPKNAKQN